MARSSRGTAARAAPVIDPRLLTEESVRALLQSFDIGVVLQGPRAEVLYANQAAAAMFGLTVDQVVGRTSRELNFAVVREDGTEVPFSMRPAVQAIETRQPVYSQVLGARRHGSNTVLWLQLTSIPQFAPDGAVTGVVTTFTNITERKHMEAEMRRAGELNREILESAQEGIAVHDRELRYIVWNPYMERMSGLRASDVIGKRPLELFPFMAKGGIYADLEKALAGEIIASRDTPYEVPQTAHHGWTNNNFAPLRDEKGEIIGVVATVRDVTERREEQDKLQQSEALLSQAEQMTNCGSWETNLKTGQVTFSKNLLQFYSLRSAAEWNIEAYWAKIHPVDRKGAHDSLVRAMAECKPFEYTVRYRVPNGSYRVHSVRAIHIPGPDGRAERSIGVVQDITDQMHKEEELRRLSARLLQLQDEERRRIARDLHDSVSQKLLAINLSLTHASQAVGAKNRQGRQALADTRKLVRDLSRGIRSLSYLLHPPMLEELGLASAIEEYARGLSHRSGINLKLDIAKDIGRLPAESEMALFRIVQEALSNIQKHSGSSSGRIRLTRENGDVVLKVSDRGRGMEADAPPQQPVSPETLGVGILGMRERMKQLGGRLDIRFGRRGTTVTARLPIQANLHSSETSHTPR